MLSGSSFITLAPPGFSIRNLSVENNWEDMVLSMSYEWNREQKSR